MKKLLLLTLLAISTGSFSQNTKKLIEIIKAGGKVDFELLKPKSAQAAKTNAIIQKIDSVLHWGFNTSSGGWYSTPNNKSTLYLYDANNNNTGFTSQYFFSSWMNSSKQDITYNASNKMTQDLYSTWNGSSWDNDYNKTYTYSAQQNLTNELGVDWVSSAWQNDWKATYTYDANNNMLTKARETYTLSAWVKDYKDIYTYNAANLPITYTYQTGNGASWLNSSRETYVYDMSNNPVLFTLETWSNSAWVNDLQATFTVVASNVTAILVQTWTGSTWANDTKGTMTYNAANKPLIETYQTWSGSTWVNDYRYIHTYDANNNETSQSYQEWLSGTWKISNYYGKVWDANNFYYVNVQRFYNSGGGPVNYGDSAITYYKTVVGIKENLSLSNHLSIYPNPSKGVFTIENATDITSINVYNTQGTQVFETKIESRNAKLDLSNLPSGMYFIRVNEGNSHIIRKVIIE